MAARRIISNNDVDGASSKFHISEVEISEEECKDMIQITVRMNGAAMNIRLKPKLAPVLDIVREVLAQDSECVANNFDPDGLVLLYQNRALEEDETAEALGMRDGDEVRGRYTPFSRLIFVRGEGAKSRDAIALDTSEGVTVRLKPADWSKTKMRDIFDSYAKQAGISIGAESLQFSFQGFPLLSSVERATPGSLGFADRDEICVRVMAIAEEEVQKQKKKAKGKKTKKSKGKKRGKKENAGAPRQASCWRDTWGFLLDGVSIEPETGGDQLRCNHGCEIDALEPNHVVWRFVDTYMEVLLMQTVTEMEGAQSGSVVPALRATYDSEEEVWLYEKHRKKAIQILLAMGANALLADANMVVGIALGAAHLESFHKGNRLNFGILELQTQAKLKRLEFGGEREVARFYGKRVPCGCLDEINAKAKLLPKTAACVVCQKVVDRSSLLVCSGCRYTEYCSRRCQEEDWSSGDHKAMCEMMRDEDMKVATFIPDYAPSDPKLR